MFELAARMLGPVARDRAAATLRLRNLRHMARTLLQEIVEATPYESLPANWSSSDLRSFSRQKQLWDYRQEAVASAARRSNSLRGCSTSRSSRPQDSLQQGPLFISKKN
jgi:hypothetical protein